MTLEKLERVMWRLRRMKPNQDTFTNLELRKAIMYECGTDDRTIYMNRKALKHLGWIIAKRNQIYITNNDITGDKI